MTDTSYLVKPGLHSHNVSRRFDSAPPKRSKLSKFRLLLLIAGLACIGYYGYTIAEQMLYQSYANWAFDREIAKPHVGGPSNAVPAEGSILGRVNIDRLNISAVVRQGVDSKTLSEAVGHVPSTALAGQVGNFAIAAHRDTLFRGLKDIKNGDLVTFQSPTALYSYKVVATKIVKPTDVSVLRPNGGDLVHAPEGSAQPKLLTMITCYPFYYVGSAPKRFIVEAEALQGQ